MAEEEEEIDFELQDLLDTISPQIEGSLAVVKSEDWSEIVFQEEKATIQSLHYLLTERNVKFALEIQKLAVNKNQHNVPTVSKTVTRLNSFYTLYKERYDKYLSGQDERLRTMLTSKEQTTKMKRNKNGKFILSSADTEVKFQNELTKSMITLTRMSRQLSDLDNPDKIVIPTFGDTPIPLAMRGTVQELFPAVKNFLEKTNNEALKTPSKTD